MPIPKLSFPPELNDPGFKGWLNRFYSLVISLRDAPASSGGTGTSLLTAEQAADLTDGGDSVLHYHADDRDRQNHTGTQTADTISDLEATVLAYIAASAAASPSISVLETQVFGF